MNMKDMYELAYKFAQNAHKWQIRKYTGTPYFEHPVAVSKMVQAWLFSTSMEEDFLEKYIGVSFSEEEYFLMAIALLHDVVEDCGVTHEELVATFGENIADGVWWLTDNPALKATHNRAERKAISQARLKQAPKEIRFIKVLDILHNTESILVYDIDFAVTFTKEISQLCEDEAFLKDLPEGLLIHFRYVMSLAQSLVEKHLKSKT